MATLTVKAAGGGDYTTIGAAVAVAVANDVVEVYNGTYSEHVTLAVANVMIQAAAGQSPVLDGLGGAHAYAFKWTAEPNATIKGLEIHSYDGGYAVLDGNGMGAVADGCYIHDCDSPAGRGFFGLAGDHGELKNCVVLRTRGGYIEAAGHVAFSSWNNLIIPQAGYPGIECPSDTNGHHYHNTVIVDAAFGKGISTGTGTAKNNICVNLQVGSVGITAFTCDYNVARGFATNYAGGGPGANDLTSDPLFVGAPDYSLQSGSPAVDSGANVGITTDLLGVARPQGAGYDRGAYEYVPPIRVRCYQIDGVDVAAYEVNPDKCEQEDGVNV